MIQIIAGLAAGYVLGTKAGRGRYEQIRKGYQATRNSPVVKAIVDSGRKGLANKIDPQPRMQEVIIYQDGTEILEPEKLSDQPPQSHRKKSKN